MASYAGDLIKGRYILPAMLKDHKPEFLASLEADILDGLITQYKQREALALRESPRRIVSALQEYPKPKKKRSYKQPLKMWPLLALAAITYRKTGAFRVWALAKNLDRQDQGSGQLAQSELRACLDLLGVNKRTQRRWGAQAKALGLLVEHEDVYYLASTAKAAIALHCPEIGRPAIIEAERLTSNGWRAHAWAAYLVTLGGERISEKVKHGITGIAPRTQRNYQRSAPVRAVMNLRRVTGPQAKVIRQNPQDINNRCYYRDGRGQLIQRLPNSWVVPWYAAKRHDCIGRSKKIQKTINATLLDVEQGKSNQPVKIFYKSLKAAYEARHAHDDQPVNNRPNELFYPVSRRRTANILDAIDLTHGESTYAIL